MVGLVAGLLILLAILGTPLFAIFGGGSMAFFALEGNATWAANEIFTDRFSQNNLMVTIPLFIFAGYIMAESGTPRRLVELSRAWLGWLPGGLAIVCIGASAFFTTFTGGSGITIVAIGGLLLPALLSDKYPERFSLGLVTAGGSLGLLFPPSLPLIIYGIVAEVMIEKLFLAGIIPGLITLIALATYAITVGIREKMPKVPFNLATALKATWDTKWEVMLPVVIVGGLLFDYLRIHEAAAFAALYTLVIEVWIYRDVSLRRDFPRIVRESTTMLGAILAILATAIGFTGYLIQAQVPMKVLDLLSEHMSSPIVFLLLLNVFLLVVGMLMDIFSAIVVVVPLIVPIATHPSIGIDPYHLGIIFLLNLEIGYLTPPVGLNLFISSYRFNKPITTLYRAVLPFIALLAIALALTTYVPALSTTLLSFVDKQEIHLENGSSGDESGSPMDDSDGEADSNGAGGDLTLDDLEGDEGDELTLDDLEGGTDDDLTLDDLEGGTDDDLTLDDLEGGTDDDLTLDDLEAEETE